MKVRFIAVLLVVTAVAISGCSFRVSNSRSMSRFVTPRTYAETYEFEVEESFSSVRLQMDLQLREGQLDWTVVDPEGAEVWKADLDGEAALSEVQTFEPRPGTWQVHFECTDGAGEFLIHWMGYR